MANLDGIYPIDVVEEIKFQEGGVYQSPNKGVVSKFISPLGPVLIVGIDDRILNNLTYTVDETEEQIKLEEIKIDPLDDGDDDQEVAIIPAEEIVILQPEGAVSFCTYDQFKIEY